MADYLTDLGHSTENFTDHEVLTIPIEQIDTEAQVRTDFKDIEAFAESILSAGRIFNPLVVVRKGRRFIVNQGERRLRALRLLVEQGHKQFSKVPVSLVAFDSDKSAFLAQLGENLSRDDLNSLEIARSIEFYRDNLDNKTGWKSRFAKSNGRDNAFVSRHLKLLELPEEIQSLVTQGLVNTPRHLIQLSEYTNYLDLIKRLEKNEPFTQVIKYGKLKTKGKKKTAAKKAPASLSKAECLSLAEYMVEKGTINSPDIATLRKFIKSLGTGHK